MNLNKNQTSLHSKAVLQALFVTLLWSSSWVLIKIGLRGIPPLTFAGMRYFFGFLLLVPFIGATDRNQIKKLTIKHWAELFALGLIMYFLTQGAQFLSLQYFPAILTALLLNLTPIVVAVISILFLKERPRKIQIVGVLICLIGASIYFVPKFQAGFSFSWLLIIPILGMLSNAVSSVLGRLINRREHVPAKIITIISMGIGSVFLLGMGVMTETIPTLAWNQWLLILWLAAINTAFAFTLWNHTLRTLSSVESSVINNTMMIQIAILAWIFLGEKLNALEIIALVITMLGTLIVQIKRQPKT